MQIKREPVCQKVRDFIRKVNFAILYFHVTAWSGLVRYSQSLCQDESFELHFALLEGDDSANKLPLSLFALRRPMVQKGQGQSIIVKRDVTGV
jgi:hypothetical protein